MHLKLNLESQVDSVSEFSKAIIENIAVRPPYLSLNNINFNGNCPQALFKCEIQHPWEIQPICTSEVGRHMAILGSLALSASNPCKEKHYYLANHAIVERLTSSDKSSYYFTGKVTQVDFNKRKGFVDSSLYNEFSEELYRVRVNYTVIHYNAFNRLFSENYQQTSTKYKTNPYVENINFISTNFDNHRYTANLGRVKPFECLGHFENYPALPVARLANALINLAGKHFNTLRGVNSKYIVMRAEITAKSLIYAGEDVVLDSILTENQPKEGMMFYTSANSAKCCKAAELTCWIV